MKKILSILLLASMLLGTSAVVAIRPTALENEDMIINITSGGHTQAVTDALTQSYLSAQDKLNNDPNMQLAAKNGNMELYVNPYTGEVYVKDTVTGQLLGTNPYYIDNYANNMIPSTLMSQLVLDFNYVRDLAAPGTTYESYTQSAARGQISVSPIKGGIRVDYVIGDTTKRYAVPYGIMADEFLDQFVIPMQHSLAEQMFALAESQVGDRPAFQENLSRFDFEAYCAQYGYKSWGNLDAYKEWYNALYKWYRTVASYQQYLALGNLATEYFSLMTVYSEKNPAISSGQILQNMLDKYPILNEKDADGNYVNAIYVLAEGLANNQLRKHETIIQKYVNGYTLDSMYEDEELTEVHGPEAENPVFYVSLQYVLTEDGVEITLPADSLVYDESLYVVNYISCLPYLGTGRIEEGGYLFYPDGSGAIIEFEDFATSNITLSAPIYGADHAYYNVTGQHQESIALPVYGTVEKEHLYYFDDPYSDQPAYCTEADFLSGSYEFTYENIGNDAKPVFVTTYPNGMTREVTQYYLGGKWQDLTKDNYSRAKTTVSEIYETSFTGGMVAFMEEGASMASIWASLSPAAHNHYSSIYARLAPKSKDSYNLADSMGAFSSSETFTIFSDSKYVGNYTTRVVMLPDPDVAAVREGYYPATYSGMAGAYRNYLYQTGVLSAIEDITEQLPLFIESFGVIETTERFLAIPIQVDAALTTFDDIEVMYKELSDAGISNIKFRLTGFANGGMYYTYPVKLSWENKVGGKNGYKDLLTFAKDFAEQGLEIFPNFNFSYIEYQTTFDGINPKKIGARSLDNRYAIRKSYSSVYQMFTRVGGIAVSTNHLEELFARFEKHNGKYANPAISLDYIGSDLSSNFYEGDLVNREESLAYVAAFLEQVQAAGYTSIMTTGGNAYAIAYVRYLLDAPIDSSRYSATSYTVPFWGMVMHGSFSYAGTAFNEEANKAEALLRAIESGAALYFTLSYDNTQLLKEDELLSDYYSVNYEISKETVKEYYAKLNAAIGGLQHMFITEHNVLSAERVITDAEIQKNVATLEAEYLSMLSAFVSEKRVEKRAVIVALRQLLQQIANEDGTLPTDYSELGTAARAQISTFIDTYESDNNIGAVIGDASTTRARINALLGAIADGTLSVDGEVEIEVVLDRSALLALAAEKLYVEDVTDLSSDFIARLDAAIASLSGSGTWSIDAGAFAYTSVCSYFTRSESLDTDYVRTNYTVDDGSVTLVTYSDGVTSVFFILNHNPYAVTVSLNGQTITLEKYAYQPLS